MEFIYNKAENNHAAGTKSTIISWKLSASNLIVLVESEIKHETFNKKFIRKQFF